MEKLTFDSLKMAEKIWFLVFCTHNQQWWMAKWSKIWSV